MRRMGLWAVAGPGGGAGVGLGVMGLGLGLGGWGWGWGAGVAGTKTGSLTVVCWDALQGVSR